MTTQIDTKQIKILHTGRLKKNGATCHLAALDAGHIGQILALEDAAFKVLGADERHYLLRKDAAFFARHFAAGGTVLGIVAVSADGSAQLVAQSIVINPTAARPETGMTDMAVAVAPEKLTVLEGVIVDPAWRGNGLMDAMVMHWLAQAGKNGRTHALAEVAVENAYSWSVFLKEGLHIESLGVDPADQSVLYNMHGHIPDLKAAFNESAKKKSAVPAADLARQKELLAQGWKGVAFDRAAGTLAFARPKKKACGGFAPH
ncbi:MAG: GNAT family N-acetyltransferase [Alphaproteobacteria bacterium]|nr:GNAT family N-acetyltransferase [Alphaproteobacteria bacterium]